MPYDLSGYLVIGVSSRALFDLSAENEIFEREGFEAYSKYQQEYENEILKPGTGFPLIEAILKLNEKIPNKRKTEVIIMSKNDTDTSLRIFNSIKYYKLDITRAALTGGASITPYLKAFKVDLFLSASEEDVQNAIDDGVAAGLIYDSPKNIHTSIDQIRIAFDGDAVIFSDESEKIYKEQGLEAFTEHEKINALKPLQEGPFAKFLKTLAYIQNEIGGTGDASPVRTALVTARGGPAHERVIRTLRNWNIRVDEAFFLGGVEKTEILKAFGPHIFFDDQDVHLKPISSEIPSARVPYKTERSH
jgi:5'-nucleotidase